ncbi:MAG: glycosyltransferase [Methanobacteriaceae archaeon]|nr:glycosyltransferase [Methanobacteriaceae archaeon]MDP2835960.1 glycosyltransferase [Methanobacteriaceae archaeon]MDP3035826.1 glycosyltransferase [Methanobacteriaceae archaeon]MDP3484549.1 glycosyltransferase [Methanobacteriaceae archaeon]
MNRFWDSIILPIIKSINSKYIIEVGSDTGLNTKNILKYCIDHDAHMTAIDPFPSFDIDEFKRVYEDKFEMLTELSLNALPNLNDYDVILLDGDHNWYTLYNELKIIERNFKNKNFPLVFLHDIGWPYARRDLYYNPQDIPENYRQPYKKLGICPGETNLKEQGGINSKFNNSIYENTSKNGVLTAVEDFIQESDLEFFFESISAFFGLGILIPKNMEMENIVKTVIKKANFESTLENERINLSLEKGELENQNNFILHKLDSNKTKLKKAENSLKEIENQLNKSKATVNEVNLQIDTLKKSFFELEYFSNKNRSIIQRLISKFPISYILLNANKTGLKNIFTNMKGYNAIKKNNLLDIGYYLKNNNDVRLSGMDPIINYMYHGFKEERAPNPSFDGYYYLKTYKDVKNSNLNPLVHYSLYGITEGRKTQRDTKNDIVSEAKIKEEIKEKNENIRSISKIKTDILLYVNSSLKNLETCIQSIFKNTCLNYRIILVNEGSEDSLTNYLKQVSEKHENLILLENRGKEYAECINKGMVFSDADYVVLLTSDTVVSKNWLENIIMHGESESKVGLISPLSNEIIDYLVPNLKNLFINGGKNKLPEYSVENMSNMMKKISKKSYPEVSTPIGSCLTIKRSVINSIGYLDKENFPHDYCNKKDYCLRAMDVGYKCVLTTNTYVFHSRAEGLGNSEYSKSAQQCEDFLKKKYGNERLSKALEELDENKLISKIGNKLFDYIENNFENYSKEYFKEDLSKIPNNYFRIFVINKYEDSSKIYKTLNSINNIDKNIPVTIITPNHNTDLELNEQNEIVAYDKSEGFLKKINDLLNKKTEEFILIIYSGDELEIGGIETLKENWAESHDNQENAAIIFDDNVSNGDTTIPRFKPGFSPEYYLEYDYIENSVWIHRDKLSKIGGLNCNYASNYIRDAILRLWEQSYKITKKDIIGLTIIESDFAQNFEEEKKFLKNTLNRRKIPYGLKINGDHSRPSYDPENVFTSIIIPFKDQINITKTCIDSILKLTEYDNYEIILLNNNSVEKETINHIDKLKENEKIRIFDYKKPFNYSKLNNFAAKYANGEVIVFLNNDTEVINGHWLTELVGDALQCDIGAVGGLLYYPDETIQHAGVVIGLKGLAGHLFAGEKEVSVPSEWIKYRRNVSSVTGACLAINRTVFEKIGGFDENFDITGSDVEICLRLLENGYRNVINPEVKLFHHERKTRSKISVRDKDIRMSIIAYGPYLENGDPYFNKNFSLNSNSLSIKEDAEYPIYQEFLNNYYQKKMNQNNKLSMLISDIETNRQSNMIDNDVVVYDVSPLELEKNQDLMAKFKRNPELKLNKVMWFIPFFDHVFRGGLYTIFRTAQHFSLHEGTDNIIVLYGHGERKLGEIQNEISAAFPKLNFELINLNEYGSVSALPYSDAAFCTFWTSAYHLVKYNSCKAKFYFNQDFEPAFYSAGSVYGLVEQTYRFGFIGITNSSGVGKAHEKYNNWVTSFTPAIDRKTFYPNKTKAKKDKWQIVFYGRPNNPRNGFRLGIEALKLVKSYFGDKVEILSVGGDFDKNKYGLDGVLENIGLLPTIEDVAELYRNCDVGLVFMFTPHPSYQPMEYMASGCATVTNINESNLWLLRDKDNAILTEPTVSCVANNIISLLENDSLRNTIIENGLDTISLTNWETELDTLLDFIKNPSKKS